MAANQLPADSVRSGAQLLLFEHRYPNRALRLRARREVLDNFRDWYEPRYGDYRHLTPDNNLHQGWLGRDGYERRVFRVNLLRAVLRHASATVVPPVQTTCPAQLPSPTPVPAQVRAPQHPMSPHSQAPLDSSDPRNAKAGSDGGSSAKEGISSSSHDGASPDHSGRDAAGGHDAISANDGESLPKENSPANNHNEKPLHGGGRDAREGHNARSAGESQESGPAPAAGPETLARPPKRKADALDEPDADLNAGGADGEGPVTDQGNVFGDAVSGLKAAIEEYGQEVGRRVRGRFPKVPDLLDGLTTRPALRRPFANGRPQGFLYYPRHEVDGPGPEPEDESEDESEAETELETEAETEAETEDEPKDDKGGK